MHHLHLKICLKFNSRSLKDEGDIVYEIKWNIVDVIVKNMMFNPADQEENDVEDEGEEKHLFNSLGEYHTQLVQHQHASTKSKEHALSLYIVLSLSMLL